MDCINIRNDRLYVSDVALDDIIAQHGTPCYIINEDVVRVNVKAYTDAVAALGLTDTRIAYAGKAFLCKYMCRLANDLGLYLDVSSGGEFYTALQAGFPAERVFMHGLNKSVEDLTLAIQNGVGRIFVDNIDELQRIDQITQSLGKTVDVSFRLKPGVEAHTHEYIQTATLNSRFGTGIADGEAIKLIRAATQVVGVNIVGIHCHIGSQIFTPDAFVAAAKIMLDFMAELLKEGIHVAELNMGGGPGIKYTQEDAPMTILAYLTELSDTIRTHCATLGIPVPRLALEPGRSLIASAGLTVYTVGSVKQLQGGSTYVVVDGGMCDNPRYMLYQANYTPLVVERPTAEPTQRVTISGRCCENGDMLGENMPLPDVRPGEHVVILGTGAYNYSMSSNYNRYARPPIVAVRGDSVTVAVRRETYDDVLKCDI